MTSDAPSDREVGTPVWHRLTRDPREPEHRALRASDADRELVREQLVTAWAEGRLGDDELDERSDALTSSRTLGELEPLVADLVTAPAAPAAPTHVAGDDLHAEAERRYRRQRQQDLAGWLVPTLICWVVWVMTGADYPWPVWVTLGTGVPLLRLLLTRQDTVARMHRELVEEQQQRLPTSRPGPDALGGS